MVLNNALCYFISALLAVLVIILPLFSCRIPKWCSMPRAS